MAPGRAGAAAREHRRGAGLRQAAEGEPPRGLRGLVPRVAPRRRARGERPRDGSATPRRAVPTRRLGLRARVRRGPALRVVPDGARGARDPHRRLQRGVSGPRDAGSAFVGIGFNVLLGAVEMVFAADGVIGFLFAWELMTLANAALVTTEHERPDARRA